tara:strand:+ start:38 stop:406 length:369 start_codon:yes stop_codon:yes gene_type:complete
VEEETTLFDETTTTTKDQNIPVVVVVVVKVVEKQSRRRRRGRDAGGRARNDEDDARGTSRGEGARRALENDGVFGNTHGRAGVHANITDERIDFALGRYSRRRRGRVARVTARVVSTRDDGV